MNEPHESLSAIEALRYGRHLVLPEVGRRGQLRLRQASVAVIGAGGLGSPVALYLAAAGVGRIGLIDFDRVDLSNLQRQVLYDTSDVGESKVRRAAERIRATNPHVAVDAHDVRLDADNARELLGSYDVVVDGSDNFSTRYLVNDACVLIGKTHVYGSIFRFEGQVSVFRTPDGPCYRCLFPEPPAADAVPNCAEGGVLGVLPGIIGTLQAAEALKLLLGAGDPLIGRLLLFDALEMRFRELELRRDAGCPVCGDDPTIRELRATDFACGTASEAEAPEVEPAELRRLLDGRSPPTLVDVRTPSEWEVTRLEGARLIPIGELDGRLDELDRDDMIVVYCQVGQRGAAAARLLIERGYRDVRNLTGGIQAWLSS